MDNSTRCPQLQEVREYHHYPNLGNPKLKVVNSQGLSGVRLPLRYFWESGAFKNRTFCHWYFNSLGRTRNFWLWLKLAHKDEYDKYQQAGRWITPEQGGAIYGNSGCRDHDPGDGV